MEIIEDYFLLYHGKLHQHKHCYLDIRPKDQDTFLEICAIFLSVNRKNFQKFIAVPSFQKLIKKYFQNSIGELNEIYEYQHNILLHLKSTPTNIKTLKEHIKFLKQQNIITLQEFNKLENILDIIKLKPIKTSKKEMSFKIKNETFLDKKRILLDFINNLKELTNINDIEDIIKEKTFSIGVTGIINSGKSTMLNALIKRDILGTSVVPETANLTVLKYAKDPKAKVTFWSKSEWKNIEEEAKKEKSIQKFISETKDIFKGSIDSFILKESRVESVNLDELVKYTSANDSSKLCNLVKSIEIQDDIEYLKDNVEIVDTPGLDDPVIQREKITRRYLSNCDALMHLMNVNQASTAVDIEFITDTILYHDISKLIVVLTKTDTVDQDQLNEVLEYTKLSIKKALQQINKENKLDFLLSKIDFVPVSALSTKGISLLDKKLKELLFGEDNQKNSTFLNSVKQKLLHAIEKEIHNVSFNIELLSKSKEELEKMLKEFEDIKKEQENILKQATFDIETEKKILLQKTKSIHKWAIDQFDNLAEIISARINDDVKYVLKSKDKKLDTNRIKYIFENGKKDGLIDIFRDLNYAIDKEVSLSKERLLLKHKELHIDEKHPLKKLSNLFIDEIVLENDKIIIDKLLSLAKAAKLKNFDSFSSDLSMSIKEYFSKLKISAEDILKNIEKDSISHHEDELRHPLKILQKNYKEKENIYKKSLSNSIEDEAEKEKKISKLYTKLNKLRSLKSELGKVSF